MTLPNKSSTGRSATIWLRQSVVTPEGANTISANTKFQTTLNSKPQTGQSGPLDDEEILVQQSATVSSGLPVLITCYKPMHCGTIQLTQAQLTLKLPGVRSKFKTKFYFIFISKLQNFLQMFSRPGLCQGLLYNHLCDLLIHSVMICENIFTAPPRPNGCRWCFQSYNRLCYHFQGDFKSLRASKLHYWFKSYSDFAERVDFAHW